MCAFTGLVAKWRTVVMGWGIAAALGGCMAGDPVRAHHRPSILSYVFTAGFVAIFGER